MNHFDRALSMVLMMLRATPNPTPQQIRAKIDLVLPMLRQEDPSFDVEAERLAKHVESLCNVVIGRETVLEGRTGHVPWLPNARAGIVWNFWKRYRRYLLEDQCWTPPIVDRLDELTDRILGLVENPRREGGWDSRGMVVGQVQSGKTANYTGLICKSADAGYRVIIVLAGMQNSLRSQTQFRLDEGFLGFNTERATAYSQNNQRIGVGRILLENEPVAHSLTGSAQNGDFSRTIANNVNVVPGGNDPVILVVKKNKSILRNLHQWLSMRAQRDGDGRSRIRGIPLLIIDDEADNASVNTKQIPLDSDGNPLDDYDVTAINGLIRQLLDTFEKSAYIGYTATPFANIFIDPEDTTVRHGEGLFPRSFILNLPAPTNYIGPTVVFGLDAAPELGLTEQQTGLPVVRSADDGELWLPSNHKNGFVPQGLPESLRLAIKSFLLACAARRARGQKKVHNSMLVHVTRFNVTQAAIADSVKEELKSLQNRLRYGDGDFRPPLLDDLRRLWESDFVPTGRAVAAAIDDPEMRAVTWNDVARALAEAAAPITVKVINGSVADILDYKDNPDGVSVIAIGGDKLSRGLTLEGLSVSYFLRSSRMYDTLMQMGRWFGYRPGYADLCRLYTSTELAGWYRHIALATEELKREFEYMAAIQGTPIDYGLRVRTHPDGLEITGAGKLRTGTVMKVSYSGTISETVVFDAGPEIIRQNFASVENFLRAAEDVNPSSREEESRIVWKGIPSQQVIAFLEEFRTHREAPKVNGRLIAEFIRKKNLSGGLTNWTVVLLAGGRGGAITMEPAGDISLIKRANTSPDPSKYAIRRLVSPSDEKTDLSAAEREQAKQATIRKWEAEDEATRGERPSDPSGFFIRQVRPADRGLLLVYPVELHKEEAPIDNGSGKPLIGIALSFPAAGMGTDDGIEYHVNNIYWEQEFELR